MTAAGRRAAALALVVLGAITTVFAVFVTPRDDKPELGDILCVLDEAGACTADRIDVPAESWSRLSLLALVGPETPPSLQEGYDRLVTTHSFDPPLRPAA